MVLKDTYTHSIVLMFASTDLEVGLHFLLPNTIFNSSQNNLPFYNCKMYECLSQLHANMFFTEYFPCTNFLI